MSTLPGHEAWRDAGLAEVDPAAVVEIVSAADPLEDLAGPHAPSLDEEYAPGEPRPDLRGEADAADVTEQTTEVGTDDREEYP